MEYELIITEYASHLLDNLLSYLLRELESKEGMSHLLEGITSVYDRLEDKPFQFPECEDVFLKKRGYRKAKIPEMSYTLIFRVEEETSIVYVMGIFHDLENYKGKL